MYVRVWTQTSDVWEVLKYLGGCGKTDKVEIFLDKKPISVVSCVFEREVITR